MRRTLFLFVVAGAALVVAGEAQAHRQGLREGYHPGIYDCSHDWGWESGHPEDLGHELVTVDLTERTEGDARLFIFELNFVQAMSVLGQRPSYETKETLSFKGPRGAFSTTIRSTDETTFTFIEGDRPAYIGPRKAGLATGATDRTQGEPDSRLIAVDIGYTYSQLRVQNGEHVSDIRLLGHYQTATGAWMQGDIAPGGTTSPAGQHEPACGNGARSPEDDDGYHVSPPFLIERSDWFMVAPPNRPPVAGFSFTPTSPTTNESIAFRDTSGDPDGNIAGWSWEFGDGTTRAERSPTHAYALAGNYTVRLRVTDVDGLSSSIEKVVRVVRPATENLPPLANFTWTPLEPFSGENVTFLDASVDPDGTIAARTWSIARPDANEASVTRTFGPGSHDVTLTVRDNDGAARNVTRTLIVLNRPPVANGTVAPSPAIVDRPIELRDASEDLDGRIVNASWTFADGSVLYGAVAHRAVGAPGDHTVLLTVRDDLGAVATRELRFLVIKDPGTLPPSAYFVVTPPTANVSEEILFSRVGQKPGETATWSIGDLTTQEGDEVRHAFARAGSYPVKLVVRDSRGMENISAAFVRILDRPPAGGFRAEPEKPLVGEQVRFVDEAIDPEGEPLSATWQFGDGPTPSFEASPTHVYAKPGRYLVIRWAVDPAGERIESTIMLEVRPRPNLPPLADFDLSGAERIQVGEQRTLTSRAFDTDGLLQRWEWRVDGELAGDAAQLTLEPRRSGPMEVTLRVWDEMGESAEVAKRLVVQPRELRVEISTRAGAADTIVLSSVSEGDIVAWEWHFVDGSVSRSQNVTRSPTGLEVVRLVATDRDGQVATAWAHVGEGDPLESASVKSVPAPWALPALLLAALCLARKRTS